MALTNKRGVFSLEDILDRQNSGNWVTRKELWNINSPIYFAGGANGWSYRSQVYRIDYATDTASASPKGPLTAAIYAAAPGTNQHYGFATGGGYPPYSSTQRYSYESDTAVLIPGGNGAGSPSYPGEGWLYGLSNDQYSFQITGRNSSTNVIGQLDFSNNTVSTIPATMSGNTHFIQTMGTNDYGYFAGGASTGYPPGTRSTVDRLDYSNLSSNVVAKGPLEKATHQATGGGNDNYGYVFGGYHRDGSTHYYYSDTQRIEYANDTATGVTRAPLSQPVRYNASSGGKNYGYINMGSGGPPETTYTWVERIDFFNDTITPTPKGNLPEPTRTSIPFGRTKFASYSSTRFTDDKLETNYSNSYAWNAGGRNYPSVPASSKVERLDFSSDTTTASFRSNLPQEKKEGTRTSSGHAGYYAGGARGDAPPRSSIFRIDYSNDTSPSHTANIVEGAPASRGDLASGNENYGYYTGGQKTYVSRIDYSNDTMSAANPLSATVYRSDAVSSPSAGYYLRGNKSPFNDIIKYDFASETAVPSYTVKVSPYSGNDLYERAAFFNKDYGYWAGGIIAPSETKISLVDRLDFSNDTATGSPKGNLSVATGEVPSSATASDSYGYVFGGRNYPSSTSYYSLTQRIDFANDTGTTPSASNMNDAKSYSMATAAPFVKNILISRFTDQSAYGTINGLGYPQPVQGFNFTPYGYVSGGQGPSYPTESSALQRLDFANDSNNFVVRAGGVNTMRAMWGASGPLAMYCADINPGSPPSGPSGSFLKVGSANDTVVQSVGSFYLGGSYFGGASTHNKSYFWLSGGWSSGKKHSDVSRLDFSNDTGGTPARGYLAAAGGEYMCGTGNQNYGYIGDRNSPGYSSNYDRIDYSNDMATALIRGSFSPSAGYIRAYSATGNANYGYFAFNNTSSVKRIDYSNDTATPLIRSSQVTFPGDAGAGTAASGNSDYGYWTGGGPYPASNSHNQRLTFASDNSTASPKGNLVVPVVFSMGTSKAQYGGDQ